MGSFAESVVVEAVRAWLESFGWSAKPEPEIAPVDLAAERGDYAHVVLTERLRQMLIRLDQQGDASRKLARPGKLHRNRSSQTDYRLLSLRHALSPKLVPGELRVKDAQRFAEAAL